MHFRITILQIWNISPILIRYHEQGMIKESVELPTTKVRRFTKLAATKVCLFADYVAVHGCNANLNCCSKFTNIQLIQWFEY